MKKIISICMVLVLLMMCFACGSEEKFVTRAVNFGMTRRAVIDSEGREPDSGGLKAEVIKYKGVSVAGHDADLSYCFDYGEDFLNRAIYSISIEKMSDMEKSDTFHDLWSELSTLYGEPHVAAAKHVLGMFDAIIIDSDTRLDTFFDSFNIRVNWKTVPADITLASDPDGGIMIWHTAPTGRVSYYGAAEEIFRQSGVPTATPTVAPTATPKSSWKRDYYVDDFGDPTKDSYIRGEFSGAFSNTATSGSELDVVVYYDAYGNRDLGYNGEISFRLLEYGKYKATHLSSEKMTFQYKVDEVASSTYKLWGMGGSNSNISLRHGDSAELIELLKQEKTIACVIKIGTSKYSFNIDGFGFSGIINSV